jgi:hypothetical protein
MKIDKKKADRNLQYARRWLQRAAKDFETFKKLVPFDRNTNKPIRCSDPALATYLLQQSVEKAVKATAIASEQYSISDFKKSGHNSLLLIINFYGKINTRLNLLGLDFVTQMMNVNLSEGKIKLNEIECQMLGLPSPLTGKKINFRKDSLNESAEHINQTLEMLLMIRVSFLETIRATFAVPPQMDIKKDNFHGETNGELLPYLSKLVAESLKMQTEAKEQLQVMDEFISKLGEIGFKPKTTKIDRGDTITNYLGIWSFCAALLMLSYYTFSHEETSRYPLRQKGNLRQGKIGCDDYTDNVGIVSQLGKMGYLASLTLNDIKVELEDIALFFAVK